MNNQSIEAALEREAADLKEKIAQHSKITDFGSDVEGSDRSEEAEQAEEFSNQLAVVEGLKNRLEEIENTINKLRSGKFGLCENCGKELSPEIIKKNPTIRLCENCNNS